VNDESFDFEKLMFFSNFKIYKRKDSSE
jgi:hypothetical protein